MPSFQRAATETKVWIVEVNGEAYLPALGVVWHKSHIMDVDVELRLEKGRGWRSTR